MGRVCVDMLMSKFSNSFGDNNVSGMITRDFVMIPSVLINYALGNNMGSTNIRYDAGLVVAAVSKFFLKAGILGGVYKYMNKDLGFGKMSSYGRAANYIADPFSKLFMVAAYDKQQSDPNNSKGYLEFFIDNFSLKWVSGAFLGSIGMVFAADMIGTHVVQKLGINAGIRILTYKLQMNVLQRALAIKDIQLGIDDKADFLTKATVVLDLCDKSSLFTKSALLSFTFLSELMGKFSTNMLNAYIIMPPSRMINDYLMFKFIEDNSNPHERHYLYTTKMFEKFGNMKEKIEQFENLPKQIHEHVVPFSKIAYNGKIFEIVAKSEGRNGHIDNVLNFLNNKLLKSKSFSEKHFAKFTKNVPILFLERDEISLEQYKNTIQYDGFLNGCYDFLCNDQIAKRTIDNTPIFLFSKETKNPDNILEWNKPLFPDNYILSPEFGSTYLKYAREGSREYEWKDKIEKIFFRGATSQSSYVGDKSTKEGLNKAFPRATVVVSSAMYPDYIDAKFSQIDNGVSTLLHNAYPDVQNLLNHTNSVEFVSPKNSIEYKYLISIDGWTAAWVRPEWILASNSLLVKEDSGKVQWFYNELTNNLHYKSIKSDKTTEDLVDLVKWLRDHDEEAKEMAQNGSDFAKEHFSQEALQELTYTILSDYYDAFSQYQAVEKEEQSNLDYFAWGATAALTGAGLTYGLLMLYKSCHHQDTLSYGGLNTSEIEA